MDYGFGNCADGILYDLKSSSFANEYYDMDNITRLKFLNELLQTLGYYGSYDLQEEE